MSVWDNYNSRLTIRGETQRDIRIEREKEFLTRKAEANPFYHKAVVNGKEQGLMVINSDDLTVKTICSMPGESLIAGSLVLWKNVHWLVTTADTNDDIYTKGAMERCNYLLKWIDKNGVIVERWCIVSDGTRYLTGETAGRGDKNGMALGDTKIVVTIARDEETVKLGRTQRFLIDDEGSDAMLAYRITKPFKVGGVYDGNGVMSFLMSEENTEDDDNFELRIANYYKYFPRTDADEAAQDGEEVSEDTTTPIEEDTQGEQSEQEELGEQTEEDTAAEEEMVTLRSRKASSATVEEQQSAKSDGKKVWF